MNEHLLQLAKVHQIEPLQQAISEIDDFNINAFFDENFMFWSVEDLDFLGSNFDITVNFNDHTCFIKPDILNYFLEKGIKFDTECIESMLTFDDGKRLAVLMKHNAAIDSSIIFNWPVFDKVNLLQVYLENGGDPNVCEEDGQSLIDYWYSVTGDCPAVSLLEEYGAKKSPDSMTMKDKVKDIEDMLKRAEEDPEFGAKLQAMFDERMKKYQNEEDENDR